MTKAVAVALDGALCDTRPLWEDWLESAEPVLGFDTRELPEDRAAASAELDRRGGGNWRTLLERWSEERAPVYLRRDATANRALRILRATGCDIGIFTDAPEPLARVTLAHLGIGIEAVAVESGASARERLLEQLGADAAVAETRAELLELAR
jgi:phosphoglycolate phosphatase-like HAD superfamily hydrolase